MKFRIDDLKRINRILAILVVAIVLTSTSTISAFASTVSGTTESNTLLGSASNSATSDTITPSPSVSISGIAQVGSTLTATTSDIADGTTVTYQWMASSGSGYANISGATSSTYTIASAEVGCTLKVVVALSDGSTIESGATSTVTEDADYTAVNTAKATIESSAFLNPSQESDYIDEAAIQAYALKLATAAVNDSSISVSVKTVSYVPAVDGTVDNPNGTAGSYAFTVTLSKGAASATTSNKSMSISAKVYTPITYEVVAGSGQEIEQGSETAVSFTIDGDVANFQALYCNGVQVNASNYALDEDTIVITLGADYVKALSAGTQEFTAVFSDGSATMNLVVVDMEESDAEEPEDTQDSQSDSDTSTSTQDSTVADTSDDEDALDDEDAVEDESEDEVIEDDQEMEFEEAEDEPEETVVVEKNDEVNSNILWYVLFAVIALIIIEIVLIKTKRKPYLYGDDELDDDMEAQEEDTNIQTEEDVQVEEAEIEN